MKKIKLIFEAAANAVEEALSRLMKISPYASAFFLFTEGAALAAPLGITPESWGKAAAGGDIRIYLKLIILLAAILLLLILPGGVFWLLSRQSAGDASSAEPEEPVKKRALTAIYAATVSAIAAGLLGGGLVGILPAIMGAGGGGGNRVLSFYFATGFFIAIAEFMFLLPCGVSWLLFRNRWFRTSIAVSLLLTAVYISPVISVIPLASLTYNGMFKTDYRSKAASSETTKAKGLTTFQPAALMRVNLPGTSNQPLVPEPVKLLVPGPGSAPDSFKKFYQSFFAGAAITFYVRPIYAEKKTAGYKAGGVKAVSPSREMSRIEFQEGKALYESERGRLCRNPSFQVSEFVFNGRRGVICAFDNRAYPELINYNLIYDDGGRALVVRYISVPKAEFAVARLPDVLATMQRQ